MNDWERRYQNGETGWDRGGANAALTTWLERGELRPGRIVVPGCGRGHEVLELARRGFDVTAIDIAPSAVAHLNRELDRQGLRAEVLLGDIFDHDGAGEFDAVYEQTCLCALDPGQWPRYEAQLHRWLKPGGRLFTLFMQTGQQGGPPFHCDLLAVRQLFDASRWQWPDGDPLFSPHRNGRFELGYVLRKIS